jgi:hypothetical protein
VKAFVRVVASFTLLSQLTVPAWAHCHVSDFNAAALMEAASRVNGTVGDLNVSANSTNDFPRRDLGHTASEIAASTYVETVMFQRYLSLYGRLSGPSDRQVADEFIGQAAEDLALRISSNASRLSELARSAPEHARPIEQAANSIRALQKQFSCAGPIATFD